MCEHAFMPKSDGSAVRLAIVSDNHGDLSFLAGLDLRTRFRPDALIHLGDMENTGWIPGMPERLPVIAVAGNRDDTRSSYPAQCVIKASGLRIVCVHGHHQMVKYGLHRLHALSVREEADVLLYGHTHQYHHEMKTHASGRRTLLLNPGSAYGYGQRREAGFVLLTIDHMKVTIHRIPWKTEDVTVEMA